MRPLIVIGILLALIVGRSSGRSLEDLDMHYVFFEVLRPAAHEHKDALRDMLKCLAQDNIFLATEMARKIMFERQSKHGVFGFLDVIGKTCSVCLHESKDKYIVALHNLILADHARHSGHYNEGYDDFFQWRIFRKAVQEPQTPEVFRCLIKEREHEKPRLNLIAAWASITEELFPGTGFHFEGFPDFLNPKIFHPHASLMAEDLVSNCTEYEQ